MRQPLVLPAEDEARPVPRPPIDGEAKRARIPPTVYLTLTNLEATALRVKDLTVNGNHLELHPSVFILSPGEIRVFDLGPFRCTLPLSIEFSDGGFWRHRVRGVPWLPSAPPENIEDWCR